MTTNNDIDTTREISEGQKWIISLWSSLLFMLLASPFMFKLTGKLFSNFNLTIIDNNGCPNYIGLVLHSIVFAILVRLMMLIPINK